MDTDKPMYSLGCLQSGPPDVSKTWKGAKVSVQLLRKDGIKLSKEERDAAPPIIGAMIVDESNNKKSGIFLAATVHSLANGVSAGSLLHRPLIDPRVIHMDERGIVFRGFEIDIVEGRVVEYSQVWLVKALP